MTFDRIGWFRAAAAEARRDLAEEDDVEEVVDRTAVLAAIADDTGAVQAVDYFAAIGIDPPHIPWSFQLRDPA